MKPRFRIDWRDEDAVRRIWVVGEIDLWAADTLSAALDCDQPRVDVHVSEVSFMDLSGLTCLIDAAENRQVVLVGSSRHVDRLLDVTGTARAFERL